MRFPSKSALLITFFTLILSACAAKKLEYKIDPELTSTQNLNQYAELIAVSVVDNRSPQAASTDEDIIIVDGPSNTAEILRKKIIERFKQQNFKIISNKLLADLAVEIQIEKLEVKVNKGLFKSTVNAASQLRLKANKQSKTFEKLYKIKGSQEVANPANELDVTGVINKLLSDQLGEIFSDQALLELAAAKD